MSWHRYMFFSIQFRQHSLIPERLNSKVKSQSIAISGLPETYTNVISAFLKSKPNPPILQTPMSMFDLDYLVRNLRLEYEWLQFVSLTNEVLYVETVSWSAYHSSKGRGPYVNISISSLTLLLRKKMLSATKL